MIKILWRSSLVLLSLLIIFIIFLLSSSGLKLSLFLAKAFIPGVFTYKTASGLITGPIQLTDIDYRSLNQEIKIKSLTLNWNVWALLTKNLSLSEVRANQIIIINHENKITKPIPLNLSLFYQKNPFEAYTEKANALAQHYKEFLQNFKLSWGVHIENAHLGPIIYYSPANKCLLELTQLSLRGNLSDKKTNLSIDTIASFPFATTLHATINGNSAHYQFNFSASGKHVDFKINGDGNIHEITLSTTRTLALNGLLQGNFHLDWKQDLAWDTNFTAKNVNFSSLYPKWSQNFQASIQSEGLLAQKNPAFNVRANIKTKNSTINLNVQHKNMWLASWELSLASAKYQTQGTLTGPFENPLTTGSLKIKDFNYKNYSAKQLYLTWKMNLVKNAPANISLSADQFVSGNFSAHQLSLNFAGTLSQHQVTLFADFDTSTTKLILSGSLNGKTWVSKLQRWDWGQFHLPAQDSIQLKITLPDYVSGLPKANDKINASLSATLSNLTFITDLVPDISVPGGKIAGTLHLNGTLENPLITGDLDFSQGKVIIPVWDLTLTNASITSLAIGHDVHYTAHAISGKQPVTIVGDTDFSQPDIPTHLKVTGNDILLINTPEYTIYGSPNVTATIVGTRLDLSGDIIIPNGLIRPHDFRNVTQLPTNEVIFVGTPTVVGQSSWQINTNLNIIAGEHLIVDSFGIHGFLDGSLHILQTPDQTLLANGKIGIRHGFYRAYGHQLKISHGSFMQFTNSPINNPVLSIEATRKVNASSGTQIQSFASEKIVVGMNIHGPVSNPDINLFSSMGNLSQSDILSYILTGATSTNNSLFGAPTNTNARGSFSYTSNILDAVKLGASGVGNTDNLISKIQSGLGFNELGFESDTTLDAIGNPLGNQTNFVIGRYLSKDLYLRYTRGIYGPGLTQENLITLRYLFRRNWAIQLETSDFSNGAVYGGDILYTTERN